MYNYTTLRKLKSNTLFKRLSGYLPESEYLRLEESIVYKRTPVTIPVWNDTILWNYSHYKICQQHKLAYEVKNYTFYNEADATVEVCCNTLDNKPTSQLLTKYAYGTLYGTFKKISSEFFKTQNHYFSLEEIRGKYLLQINKSITASVLANRYPPSASTFSDYYMLSRSIDHILELAPSIDRIIFDDDFAFSARSLVTLSRKSNNDIKLELINYAKKTNNIELLEEITKRPLDNNFRKRGRSKKIPLIKDMPTYDPDAEVSSLTFTISAWCNSIERTIKISDIEKTSTDALIKLDIQLDNLLKQIRKLRRTIKEAENAREQ